MTIGKTRFSKDGKRYGANLSDYGEQWRTPDSAGQGGPRNRQGSIGNGHQVTIAEQAEHWKTPHGMSNRDAKGKVGGCGGREFAKQANQWQTPLAGNQIAEDGGNGGGMPLRSQTEMWQTPATDSFRSRGGDRKDEMGLDQQARFFPTPTARDWRSESGGEATKAHYNRPAGPSLPAFVLNECGRLCEPHPAPPIPDGQQSSQNAQTSRRRLNPRFVEWLMGFPIGWTEL